jgi:hypothetical protein
VLRVGDVLSVDVEDAEVAAAVKVEVEDASGAKSSFLIPKFGCPVVSAFCGDGGSSFCFDVLSLASLILSSDCLGDTGLLLGVVGTEGGLFSLKSSWLK